MKKTERKSVTLFCKKEYNDYAILEHNINAYLTNVYEVGDKLHSLHSDNDFVYLTIISCND